MHEQTSSPLKTGAAQDLTLSVGGVALHARRWLAQEGRTWLVFLHEALGSVSRWRDYPESLVEALGYGGLAYDRQGHGLSPARKTCPTPDYLQIQAMDVLPALLDQAGIERAVLCGHSDGATIALIFAAAYPQRAAAVVAEAPHVFVEPETRAGILAAREAFADPALYGRLARHHGSKTQELLDRWSNLWLSDAYASWSVVADMSRIRSPVMLIQGSADQYGTRRQLTAIADRVRGPVEIALLQGIGHVPHHQASGLVRRLVAGFVARWADPARGGVR